MSTRWSKRLAGCIAIELLLPALLAAAADVDFKAGAGSAPHARAVALEDRHGARVVFVEADFPLTRAIADSAAVQLVKLFDVTRASVLLRGEGRGAAQTGDLVGAATEAFRALRPARLTRSGDTLSIDADGCLATMFPIAFGKCTSGLRVSGDIRSAFHMVETGDGLRRRADPVPGYPVQTLAIGRQVTILALSGEVSVARIQAESSVRGLIVLPHANDSIPLPEDVRVRLAIRQTLARVGR
jgi:hypothetical protein